MDDEAADIQLLDQYLNKTTQISTRMTTILKKFDDRLKHLEKSILPLHTSTLALTRIADNIDRTMNSIDKVASNQEDISAEENLIMRGPRPNDLSSYIDALERLNANLAFGGDRSSRPAAALIETGAKKLSQLYTKLVAEACSEAPVDPLSYLPSPPSQFPTLPPQTLKTLQPLVNALRGLPLPATHPSHPAAQQILATLKEAQSGYAEMRGLWTKRCLEPSYRATMGRIETDSSLELATDVTRWLEAMIALTEAEHEAFERIVLLPAMTTFCQNTFAALCQPMITMVAGVLATIEAHIKRAILPNAWLALGLYSSLGPMQQVWEDAVRGRSGRRENELGDAINGLRKLCLRSAPEFIAEIRQAGIPPNPNAKQVELGTGVADVTKMTVKFLFQIPEVQMTFASLLRTIGDGKWNMGAGAMKAAPDSDVTDQQLLEHFTHDVVTALTASLTAMSKQQRRPALASIFLLNNISFLRSKLLLEPETPVDDFISTQTQSHLNSQYRTAKASYFEANFSVLLGSLQEDRAKGTSKAGTKEKFATFFDSLEEVAERHRFARVLGEDPAGRDGLADDVARLVIPALQRFMQKHKDKEFSKNPQKYIKATPDEVEKQIRNFYR